ncbi:MAG: alpha/beta hydrolase [Streptosporangiales bacterium]|nr:alpha/beta hydrolase [Streptosporangiales bacterium]
MARMDLRVQAWSWVTRRQAPVSSMTEAQVAEMQARPVPDNKVTGWLFGTRRTGTSATDRTIPGPDGNEIPVRIYRSGRAVSGDRPLIMYFHGGGFVFGTLRMGDWLCSSAAAATGAVVVSVDYRLAPAHRFPAAVDDCYAALTWAAGHAAELGAGGPVAVMGESAGGNLSAVVSLLARDNGGPAIAHQALLYPATDMSEAAKESRSRKVNANAPILSVEDMTAFRRLYLGHDGETSDPKASPLLAPSHEGLPPALIQVAEHDPLKDDGVRYAEALRAAGVPVRLTEYVGQPHGFMNFPGLCRSAQQALAELRAEQKAALTPETAPRLAG